MTMTFGARLRAQRERQRVTLDAIAEKTKIRGQLLDELERDNIAHWPGGIFRRSYLRTYAQAIGLDPEATVREFLELYPDPVEDAPAVIAAAIPSAPPTRLKYLIASAIDTIPQLFHAGRRDVEPERMAAPAKMAASSPGVELPIAFDEPMPVSPDLKNDNHQLAEVETVPDPVADELPAMPAVPHAAESEAAPVAPVPPAMAAAPSADLAGMAQLCQALACARVPGDVATAMATAARVLKASGAILWMWDPSRSVLWPSLSHGYPRAILAQLPAVLPNADNAIATAFRSSSTRVVDGSASSTGAVVVPVVGPDGCAGALALEFRDRVEQQADIQALATILAAQLSMLAEAPSMARAATA